MHCDIRVGDCLEVMRQLPDASVHCCVTSPPYWGLRDYGVDGQLGLEKTPEEYTQRMVEVFREVRRVLRDDGTLWLNLGDSYGKGKQLAGVPWRVAFALQADGWILRQDLVWHKPSPMPESVRDRCTKAHEYVFLLAKGQRYFFDAEAIGEDASNASGWAKQRAKGVNTWDYGRDGYVETRIGGMSGKETYENKSIRNRRSVWTITPKLYSGAHFATMPPDLAELCIRAGTDKNASPPCTVFDPFAGAGTTGLVALRLGRNFLGIELNPDYVTLARNRIASEFPLFV